jgi:small subunit ribosomal protein S16
MVKIRLSRRGRKKIPFYRIVVTDSRKARDGEYIENVGHYDPRKKELKLNRDRIEYWISKGAQPTNTVAKLIAKDKGGSS